jgi:flavin-dependent dehydrogenase
MLNGKTNRFKSSGLGPLTGGSRAVIIGGGPGGVAAAIALKEGAEALGREVSVILVEGKQFAGGHHNQCVGVLSPTIAELMERELNIPFPSQLGRCHIYGYVLHTGMQAITLDGEEQPSVSLRRVQFDAYMLEAARQRGIEIYPARATGLEFHDNRVVIYTENTPLAAEVVVGAFGMDEGTGVLFQRAVGYRPPASLSSVVTKYHPGPEGMLQFGNRIHAFLPRASRIEFGGITPKGNHLTINIAGKTVDANLMDAFLAMPQVRQVLPCFENAGRLDAQDLRYFKGRFPCGLAQRFTGDRYVMVGDAAGLVRAFKGKGVTSAVQTGLRAAHVILHQGISGEAFRAYHAANRDITSDLPFGQAMRYLTILASRLGLMGVVVRAAEHNPGLQQALFDAVSANQPYWQVIRHSLTFRAMRAMILALVRSS